MTQTCAIHVFACPWHSDENFTLVQKMQVNLIITLSLQSMETDHVISEAML